MRLLLDTHVWLWWLMTPTKLGAEASAAIEDVDNEVLLSAISSWEMAIKIAAGKLQLPEPLDEMVAGTFVHDGIGALAVTHAHALELARLPMLHRDPFDRMLVAQARADTLTLVTADSQIQRYDVPVLIA